jgi:hypothetical protein
MQIRHGVTRQVDLELMPRAMVKDKRAAPDDLDEINGVPEAVESSSAKTAEGCRLEENLQQPACMTEKGR